MTTGQVLTADQITFSKTVARQTGLDPNVIGAWVLQEGGSATGGKFNYLNIGNTDSGARNKSAVWNGSPVTAGAATAQWLKGQTKAGYSTASPGIQAILKSAGGTAEEQVKAIQTSGWATSGEPQLGSILDRVASSGELGRLNDPAWKLGTSGPFGVGIKSGSNTAVTVDGLNPLSTIGDLIGAISSPAFWIRAVELVGGVILLVLGLKTLTGISASPASIATKVAA